jgi:hypothetical protein
MTPEDYQRLMVNGLPQEAPIATYGLYLPAGQSRICLVGQRTRPFDALPVERRARGLAHVVRAVWKDIGDMSRGHPDRHERSRAIGVAMWRAWARAAGYGVPFCLFCGNTEFVTADDYAPMERCACCYSGVSVDTAKMSQALHGQPPKKG